MYVNNNDELYVLKEIRSVGDITYGRNVSVFSTKSFHFFELVLVCRFFLGLLQI